jgi:hypothetical protein
MGSCDIKRMKGYYYASGSRDTIMLAGIFCFCFHGFLLCIPVWDGIQESCIRYLV